MNKKWMQYKNRSKCQFRLIKSTISKEHVYSIQECKRYVLNSQNTIEPYFVDFLKQYNVQTSRFM